MQSNYEISYSLQWRTEGRQVRTRTTYGLKSVVAAESKSDAIKALTASVMLAPWNLAVITGNVAITDESPRLVVNADSTIDSCGSDGVMEPVLKRRSTERVVL